MLKRFLEINVNTKGRPKDAKTSKNYLIFKNNNLKICEDDSFFKKHFGQHPVIFIDYKPLTESTSFNSMLDLFKIILRKTFLQHEYLLQVKKLWVGSLNSKKFTQYIDPEMNENLTILDIKQGLIYLSEILYKHFQKKIFILIDEYDSYLNSMIFKTVSEIDEICNFIQSVNMNLLKYNDYLNRAVITGVLRVSGVELSAPGNNVKEYLFLRNYAMDKFFGITEYEIDDLLLKLIPDKSEINKTKQKLFRYYGGYTGLKYNTTIYNIWSVLNFLENDQQAITYWCRPEYVQGLLPIFGLEEIQQKIEDLLSDKTIVLDIATPLTKHSISSINFLLKGKQTSQQSVLWFFNFIFELGYLSVRDANSNDLTSIYVKIPNLEVKLEFAHIMRLVYMKQHDISLNNIDALNTAINSISSENVNHVFFEICKSLNNLFGQLKYHPKNENHFRSILLVSFMTKFHSVKSNVFNPIPPSYIDVLLCNENRVYFIMKIKKSLSTIRAYREQIAVNSHKEIILKGYINYLDMKSRNKVVYLGIGYSIDKNISIGYSYYLKEGDNLGYTKILS
uniref:AAA-ATPase-like domain-containing protein n=1 Tax=Clastoptera arizonana TaxID=38151 RepID=A0A1B6DN42_9HEMI